MFNIISVNWKILHSSFHLNQKLNVYFPYSFNLEHHTLIYVLSKPFKIYTNKVCPEGPRYWNMKEQWRLYIPHIPVHVM